MPRERKTVDIATLKAHVNDMLAKSVDNMSDGRVAVSILLESILMEANAYRGFRYLTDIPSPDDTRRYYY